MGSFSVLGLLLVVVLWVVVGDRVLSDGVGGSVEVELGLSVGSVSGFRVPYLGVVGELGVFMRVNVPVCVGSFLLV